MEPILIRFEQSTVKPNTSRNAYVDFRGCDIQSIKGISGITQYEDQAEFAVNGSNRWYFPDFSIMHYLQFEFALIPSEHAALILCEGEDRLEVPLGDVTDEMKHYRVNDRFAISIFRYRHHETGSISVSPDAVRAHERASIDIRYTASETIHTGGKIRILTPYTCWSEPCGRIRDRFFYDVAAVGLEISQKPYAFPFRGTLYEITVTEGELRRGEGFTVIHTNLHQCGVLSQAYAQDEIYFLGWEDTDGKGIFNSIPLAQCGKMAVTANQAAKIRLTANQVASEQENIRIRVSVTDECWNPQEEYDHPIAVQIQGADGLVSRSVSLSSGEGEIILPPMKQGLYTITASGEGLQPSRLSLYVTEQPEQRLYFGQIHGHSAISDGTFSMEDYFRFGRDNARLDFCALSDHDWELIEHARNRENHRLDALIRVCDQFNQDDQYAAIIGYEWMGQGGHMNVYFRSNQNCEILPGNTTLLYEGQLYPTQASLLEGLAGRDDVLVIPHLSHGFFWDAYSPEQQTAVEIYSMWGYSDECGATAPQAPGFSDILNSGKQFSFLSGADSHHGMPGQTGYHSKYFMLSYREGLSGVLAPRLTREDIFDGIKARRTYATTGERILLLVSSDIREESIALNLVVGGTDEVCAIVLYANGKPIQTIFPHAINGIYPIQIERTHLEHENYYIKVVQRDGEMAYYNIILE